MSHHHHGQQSVFGSFVIIIHTIHFLRKRASSTQSLDKMGSTYDAFPLPRYQTYRHSKAMDVYFS